MIFTTVCTVEKRCIRVRTVPKCFCSINGPLVTLPKKRLDTWISNWLHYWLSAFCKTHISVETFLDIKLAGGYIYVHTHCIFCLVQSQFWNHKVLF